MKTGSYRPSDLARAIKFASLARIDVLTIDGSGGGTGMSPWRMMNEWGSANCPYCGFNLSILQEACRPRRICSGYSTGRRFGFEDHIYKSFALLHPLLKRSGCPDQPSAPPW